MKIIGHRGAKGLAPENTIASFQKALDYKVDMVELDVQVSSDGYTLVAHNPDLSDPAGNRLKIAYCTYEELKAHKPDLATLQEVIEFIDRRVPIIVELKPDIRTEPVKKVLRNYLDNGWRPEDFWLASRSQPILLDMHSAFPEVETMVIDFWSGVRATHRARQLGTKKIGMLEYGLWPWFIQAMKRGGYELYSAPPGTPEKERLFERIGLAGQTNNPARSRQWVKYGLAGVITDFPDRFEN